MSRSNSKPNFSKDTDNAKMIKVEQATIDHRIIEQFREGMRVFKKCNRKSLKLTVCVKPTSVVAVVIDDGKPAAVQVGGLRAACRDNNINVELIAKYK